MSPVIMQSFHAKRGKYFILWDIVDPRTESNPNQWRSQDFSEGEAIVTTQL